MREVGFEYDAMGNLQKVIYKDGSTIGYKYEDLRYPHFLTGVTDEIIIDCPHLNTMQMGK